MLKSETAKINGNVQMTIITKTRNKRQQKHSILKELS